MNLPQSAEYIVFLCDDRGKIRQVLHDDLGLEKIIQQDLMFPSIVHRDSLGKSLDFLLEILTNDSAFGWEFNISRGGDIQSYCFVGFKDNQDIRVIGSKSEKDLLDSLRNWIENQDGLEVKIGESLLQSFPTEIPSGRESRYFDELTRMYNEISNMHRELAKKNTELERMNDLKNRFLGMAAHDLRTSLWTIHLYSQFLLDELRDMFSEEHLELLKTIMDSSDQLKNIVSDYLDIATIESGKLHLEFKPTDLVILCKNCVRVNQILASKKRIRLNFNHENLPELNLDKDRIEQVLNNLIHNAIKFSSPLTEINIHLYRSGDEAIIQVRDEGIGIPDDIAQILFEPFEGKQTMGTDEERGSGMGLAIVRKVVQEHRGRVWVESEVGEGSTFFVALPIAGTSQT